MSTHKKATRHPQTGDYESATWRDDYFGAHTYGVEFPSDGKVYPVDLVSKKRLETFWVEDVIKAFGRYMENSDTDVSSDELVVFLNLIEEEYRGRWKRDPTGGEGAIDWPKFRGIKSL